MSDSWSPSMIQPRIYMTRWRSASEGPGLHGFYPGIRGTKSEVVWVRLTAHPPRLFPAVLGSCRSRPAQHEDVIGQDHSNEALRGHHVLPSFWMKVSATASAQETMQRVGARILEARPDSSIVNRVGSPCGSFSRRCHAPRCVSSFPTMPAARSVSDTDPIL